MHYWEWYDAKVFLGKVDKYQTQENFIVLSIADKLHLFWLYSVYRTLKSFSSFLSHFLFFQLLLRHHTISSSWLVNKFCFANNHPYRSLNFFSRNVTRRNMEICWSLPNNCCKVRISQLQSLKLTDSITEEVTKLFIIFDCRTKGLSTVGPKSRFWCISKFNFYSKILGLLWNIHNQQNVVWTLWHSFHFISSWVILT